MWKIIKLTDVCTKLFQENRKEKRRRKKYLKNNSRKMSKSDEKP